MPSLLSAMPSSMNHRRVIINGRSSYHPPPHHHYFQHRQQDCLPPKNTETQQGGVHPVPGTGSSVSSLSSSSSSSTSSVLSSVLSSLSSSLELVKDGLLASVTGHQKKRRMRPRQQLLLPSSFGVVPGLTASSSSLSASSLSSLTSSSSSLPAVFSSSSKLSTKIKNQKNTTINTTTIKAMEVSSDDEIIMIPDRSNHPHPTPTVSTRRRRRSKGEQHEHKHRDGHHRRSQFVVDGSSRMSVDFCNAVFHVRKQQSPTATTLSAVVVTDTSTTTTALPRTPPTTRTAMSTSAIVVSPLPFPPPSIARMVTPSPLSRQRHRAATDDRPPQESPQFQPPIIHNNTIQKNNTNAPQHPYHRQHIIYNATNSKHYHPSRHPNTAYRSPSPLYSHENNERTTPSPPPSHTEQRRRNKALSALQFENLLWHCL